MVRVSPRALNLNFKPAEIGTIYLIKKEKKKKKKGKIVCLVLIIRLSYVFENAQDKPGM